MRNNEPTNKTASQLKLSPLYTVLIAIQNTPMEVIKRKSCRAILLTPEQEILLIKIANPKGGWTGWITPGGGLDDGETEIAGLKRELKEELGFVLTDNVPEVWRRFHSFPWNDKFVEQHESFYFVQTPKFNPSAEAELTESEMLDFKEMRWWNLKEIAQTKEEFAPREFYRLLNQLIQNGIPNEPIVVGI